jgi:hypothetical protein
MEEIPTKMHQGREVWDQSKLQVDGNFSRRDKHPHYEGVLFGYTKRCKQYWVSAKLIGNMCLSASASIKKNPEARREYKRKKYWENPEKSKAASRSSHQKHKVKRNKISSEYYSKNKESCAATQRKYYEKNKDKILGHAKGYSIANSESIKEKGLIYRENNREILAGRSAKYREGREEKARQYAQQYRKDNTSKTRADAKRWRLSNPAYCAARGAARRTRMKVSNLSEHHRGKIIDIYNVRDELNLCALSAGAIDTFHVDHIMPLKHKKFSGLHAPWNLAIIPARDNMRKGNRVVGY